MKTVAVFFGGRSNEHEISIITGLFAVNLLRGAGYRVLPVYLPREGGMVCSEKIGAVEDFKGNAKFPPVQPIRGGLSDLKGRKKIAVDCALNCCHGGGGEGGVLAALLTWYEIPSASPNLAESAVFLDKILSKTMLKGLGIPVAEGFGLREGACADWRERAKALGYPVVVKPSRLGSSIGVCLARDEEALEKALALGFRLDGAVLVERYLPEKRDLNCAAVRLGGKVTLSEVEEVFSAGELLSFGEKYEGKAARASELPAAIPQSAREEIRSMLLCVYEHFDMRGVVRGDFLLSEGKVYLNELNTVPGTLAAYLFGERLTDARDFLVSLIEEAHREPQRELLSSGILSAPVFGTKSAKRREIGRN